MSTIEIQEKPFHNFRLSHKIKKKIKVYIYKWYKKNLPNCQNIMCYILNVFIPE